MAEPLFIYGIRNKGTRAMWVAAPNTEAAIKIAMDLKFARNSKNLIIEDMSIALTFGQPAAAQRSMVEIMEARIPGQLVLCGSIPNHTWKIYQEKTV